MKTTNTNFLIASSEPIPIENLINIAFGSKTPTKYANYLQGILITQRDWLKENNLEWDRLIFLMNPQNGNINVWVD